MTDDREREFSSLRAQPKTAELPHQASPSATHVLSNVEKINDVNYAVRDGAETVGFVLHYAIGNAPGWYFVAAHKRFTNRFPDSAAPKVTWQEAVPS